MAMTTFVWPLGDKTPDKLICKCCHRFAINFQDDPALMKENMEMTGLPFPICICSVCGHLAKLVKDGMLELTRQEIELVKICPGVETLRKWRDDVVEKEINLWG